MDSVKYSRVRRAKGGMSTSGKTIRLSKTYKATDNSKHQLNNRIYCNICCSRVCAADEPDTLRKLTVVDIREDFYIRSVKC